MKFEEYWYWLNLMPDIPDWKKRYDLAKVLRQEKEKQP